jgi:O-antigen ligase
MRWLVTVDASRFVLVTSVGLAMSLTVVLTGSRSGIASLILAFAVLGAAMWRSLRHGQRRLLVPVYLGVIVLGALAWGGIDTLAARFANAPVEAEGRLSAWRDSVTIMRHFPVFGTGLGTYGHAMLVYQTSDRASMYAQAHNDYIQLAAEGGLLVGLPVIVVAVIIARGIRRRLTSPEDDLLTAWIRRGAVAGIIGVGAQSLVEFSLQMPGNAVLFVTLLALALHRPSRHSHAHRV